MAARFWSRRDVAALALVGLVLSLYVFGLLRGETHLGLLATIVLVSFLAVPHISLVRKLFPPRPIVWALGALTILVLANYVVAAWVPPGGDDGYSREGESVAGAVLILLTLLFTISFWFIAFRASAGVTPVGARFMTGISCIVFLAALIFGWSGIFAQPPDRTVPGVAGFFWVMQTVLIVAMAGGVSAPFLTTVTRRPEGDNDLRRFFERKKPPLTAAAPG